MKTTLVYDTITGVYIDRVPIYRPSKSCSKKPTPRKHIWILNTVHNMVCINCGIVKRINSYYDFALEAGLLPRISWE